MDFMNSVFGYCSWLESDIDSKIIDFVDRNKYRTISKYDVDDFLNSNGLDYFNLTQYQKDKLDEIDLY